MQFQRGRNSEKADKEGIAAKFAINLLKEFNDTFIETGKRVLPNADREGLHRLTVTDHASEVFIPRTPELSAFANKGC